MSASTIARWNAIPMNPEPANDNQHVTKRTRPEDEGSDDDVSLVSRSPSPDPDGMDVDPETYREHLRGPVHEVITVETKIKPENRGFALLAKMGWSAGQPLGLSGDGRVDPIPFQLKNDSTGIGKTTQDIRMIETTVSQRKGLDSERQRKETEDQRKAREELVARKAALESEITTTLRAFYCELCDKQFKNVSQYDEHTNSYAHHHKARLRDMNANARPTAKEDLDKRKEKERRREEKELRKIAAANGIKMPKPPVHASTSATLPISEAIPSSGPSTNEIAPAPPSEPKKGGWATVSLAGPQSGFKKSGWATVSSQPQPPQTAPPPPPSSPSPWPPASTSAQPSSVPSSHTSSAPAFRNAGWTSLDTGSSQQIPSQPAPAGPVPPATSQAPPMPPSEPPLQSAPRPSGGGWKQFQSSIKGKTRR
ncbi:hypothetical protein D9611_003242 [Ephemerocybe angulata]|uniref:G-patch domain-containing protein n=1 Tax=Ephemerocybe angulata TaxID=980116 RepID=A0A8H5C9Z1_9AGAR|nr:hypothetical protein D9611_003242 [Tulosesus angulatus]